MIVGEMEMWNTKFQPFVVRAGGEWGEPKPCLDADIRRSRIEFWPFVSAGLLLLCSAAFFGGYAAKRTWFTDQKVDYGNYEEGNMKVQHEMDMVRQQLWTRSRPRDTRRSASASLRSSLKRPEVSRVLPTPSSKSPQIRFKRPQILSTIKASLSVTKSCNV